jgi:hypothetical protein
VIACLPPGFERRGKAVMKKREKILNDFTKSKNLKFHQNYIPTEFTHSDMAVPFYQNYIPTGFFADND